MTRTSSPSPSESFITRFLARLSPEVAGSFSPDQLAAVQRAFGMRYAMEHAVDVRRTLHLPWGRYYLVLLGGKDRRREGRRGLAQASARLAGDTLICGSVFGLVLAGAIWLVRAVGAASF